MNHRAGIYDCTLCKQIWIRDLSIVILLTQKNHAFNLLGFFLNQLLVLFDYEVFAEHIMNLIDSQIKLPLQLVSLQVGLQLWVGVLGVLANKACFFDQFLQILHFVPNHLKTALVKAPCLALSLLYPILNHHQSLHGLTLLAHHRIFIFVLVLIH